MGTSQIEYTFLLPVRMGKILVIKSLLKLKLYFQYQQTQKWMCLPCLVKPKSVIFTTSSKVIRILFGLKSLWIRFRSTCKYLKPWISCIAKFQIHSSWMGPDLDSWMKFRCWYKDTPSTYSITTYRLPSS